MGLKSKRKFFFNLHLFFFLSYHIPTLCFIVLAVILASLLVLLFFISLILPEQRT